MVVVRPIASPFPGHAARALSSVRACAGSGVL